MQDAHPAKLHLAIRRARQAAGLRQSELADQVGCTQSALSMFEGGKASAISIETAKKLAERLEIQLPDGFGEDARTAPTAIIDPSAQIVAPGSSPIERIVPVHFCPNFQCLSNLPYSIGGQILFMPLATAGDGLHCSICGEILETTCPACGARILRRGGCCGKCGAPLIEWPDNFADDPAAWLLAQRTAISSLTAPTLP